MDERSGDATLFGEPLTVIGPLLAVSDAAPDFTLIDFDPTAFRMTPFTLADLQGKTAVLSVVVSLDTPVCHAATQRWDQEFEQLRGVELLTISKDLPFAQARWKEAAGVHHRTLSAYQDDQFATAYGVLLKEPRLLQRSVFVIAPDGHLAHVDYVKEQSNEPNYRAALDAARQVAGPRG